MELLYKDNYLILINGKVFCFASVVFRPMVNYMNMELPRKTR